MKIPALPDKRVLVAILFGFILLGVTYSITTPIFEAPDELYHYPFIDHLATEWALPVQPPAPGATPGPWMQEGSQPPLAYFLGALLVAAIKPTDFSTVYQPNPYAALGEVHADGSNVNAAIHSPLHERWPWHGTVLAVHLVRLLAVFYGVCAVYLTWRLVGELWPDQPWLANGAAALHAFTPMFIFISAAVNNDALLIPLCTLALLQMVRLLKAPSPRLRDFIALGLTIGGAVLTKESALALLPFAGGVSLLRAWPTMRLENRPASFRKASGQMLGTLLKYGLAWTVPVVLVAGWWYARNIWLYGDLLGLDGFLILVGRRLYPPNFWQELPSLLRSYWGIFGWFNVPMANWIYVVLNGLLILASLGMARQLFAWLWRASRSLAEWRMERTTWALALVGIWPLAVLAALIRWTSLTPASQGRLLFPAIAILSASFLLGLSAWWPAQVRWPTKPQLAGTVAVFLAGISLVAPSLWILPAYQFPAPLSATQIAAIQHPLSVNFGDNLQLLGYDLDQKPRHPGDLLEVVLYWAAQKPTATPHSIYLHVLGEGERIVAQRNAFPGRGLFATTELTAGMTWLERYQIPLSSLAYAPDQLSLAVGVYATTSGQRLPGLAHFGEIMLQPQPATPLAIRFGEAMHLTGYQLNKLAVSPGRTVTLTLDWQSSAPLPADYTVSVQLINAQGQKAAQLDSAPAIPTTKWSIGQQIEEKYTLPIDGNAPSGLYDLRLVVYSKNSSGKNSEEELQLLPIVWDINRMPEDNIVLTQIRIK